MSKMMIENPEEIEFTKVNSFSIHFKYNGKYYLLLHNTITGNSLILYEKINNSNRNLRVLSSTDYYKDFKEFIQYTHPKKTLKYIDKSSFVRRLVWYKLAYNKLMINCCCELGEYIKYNKKSIDNLNSIINDIHKDTKDKLDRYLNTGVPPTAMVGIDLSRRSDIFDIQIPEFLNGGKR